MNKQKLKQLTVLLAAITMMSCAAACGEEAVSGDVPQVTAEAAAESAEVSQKAESKQLMLEDMNRIEIKGKTVSFPFSVEELGDDFSIGGNSNDELFYNEESMGYINTDENDKSKITSLTAVTADIKIGELSLNEVTTENDIISIWGEPEQRYEAERDGHLQNILYYRCSDADTYDVMIILRDSVYYDVTFGY